RWPRWVSRPNIAASVATASFSIWPVAGPPSSAWLFGLMSIAARYPATAAGCGGLSVGPAQQGREGGGVVRGRAVSWRDAAAKRSAAARRAGGGRDAPDPARQRPGGVGAPRSERRR